MTTIDQFTLTAIPLEQYFNDTYLGQATGFLWSVHNQHYLVTNWHVVAAQDFFTRVNLHKHGGRANMLRARFQIPGTWEKQQYDIYIRDKNDNPLWLIHPSTRVDIAVLPFTPQEPMVIGLYPLNVLANAGLHIAIGMEVFILGFPFKIAPPAFPVWKRGSIASEPDLARLTTGYMHVDTASRPGMSGAPVIRRSWGMHIMGPGAQVGDGNARTRFLGVYSGRVPVDHPQEAQIGLVWDGTYIDEIIAGGMKDT
jgi:S1-C subfamily serine protease